ncbi:MAG TPA: hypothetical protein VKF35_15880 [Hyphomicrobiaceae bacterium]|nr:hypothetical protein [Hyphomicrobiaceae bacterium]
MARTQRAPPKTTDVSTAQEIIMAVKSWLPVSAALFAVTAVAANAQAGPAGGTARELASAAGAGSAIAQVAARVCWVENGIRHCRRANRVYGYRPAANYLPPGSFGYGPPIGYGYRGQIDTDPNDYPIGSSQWWQNMDSLDRGGQGQSTGQ